MSFERMKARVLALPGVSGWPVMVEMIERATHQEWRSLWDYPFIACRAVGAADEAAIPGAAAVFCSLASIHLVDDMLDEDDRGQYRKYGAGPTANLALAFQALAHQVLDEVADPEVRAALQTSVARMAFDTAAGQNLDATWQVRDEAGYWRVVEAKTPPLFGSAFFLGALLGGASHELAEGLERVGRQIGRFIQVSDDLADALKAPAGADWRRRNNNLALLYALQADHPERERFARLADAVDDPEVLAEAHQVLVRSGALSYCVLRLIEAARQARESLDRLALPCPEPVVRLMELQLKPLERLFRVAGVEEPAEILHGG